MASINGDFGFCNAEYTAANPYQDRQKLINWYPEISSSPYSKGEDQGKNTVSAGSVISLLGCPGLRTVASVVSIASLPIGSPPP